MARQRYTIDAENVELEQASMSVAKVFFHAARPRMMHFFLPGAGDRRTGLCMFALS